ncbi:hypothetical protein HOLleu_10558 [Holothuria leucospilota]|uniref:Peptidase aspartic putative domain-containing protein n=1 Tax=Holothuria leucospilota TaxID=206669 RepID=A0A9Q1CEH2_HOLLE|nr:hypothetical protein HOLleu_10558 [Holothuria leucospilota]
MAKTARSSAKRAVTKEVNYIRQCIAEDDMDDIDDHVIVLKDLFKKFTLAHDRYHETLTQETDIDESDNYFSEKQRDYISVLDLVKNTKISFKAKAELKSLSADSNSGDSSSKEYLRLLNLPKVELEVFHGNPLHFHQFIKAFEANVDKVCDDDDLKLSRLMQYTAGPAKEAIRGCQLIGGTGGYAQARSILDSRFGDPHLVTERLIRELKFGKQVKTPQEIRQLSDDIKNAFLVLSQLRTLQEVNSQSVIREIMGRFPNYVQLKWKKRALKSKKSNDSYPTFKEFVEFAAEIAGEVNDPVYGNVFPKRSDRFKREQRTSSESYSVSLSNSNVGATGHSNDKGSRLKRGAYAKSEPPCVLCSQVHRLWHCDQFKQMSPRERLDVVINHKLCHNCLLSSHRTDDCGKRSVCSVPGCGKKHTKYIHLNDNTSNNVQVSNASFYPNKGTHMPLVQVLVNDACKVYALLDSGSSNSFCSRALVRRLGLTGKSYEFQLRTLNKSGPQRSEAVGLSLSSESGETLELSAVYVVDEIPVKSTRIETACYPHLDGLGPMPAYQTDSLMVDLLIGQDNAEALVPLEVRRGKPGEPYAIRTLFGWCVNGQSPTKVPSHNVISNFISALPVRDDVSRLWEIENEGIGPSSWSREDKLVIDLWDRECRKVDGHYELPIPWRDRSEPLPNNFVVAKPRLDNLHKRLLKEGIYDRYNAEIAKLLERGYAEEVPRSELLNQTSSGWSSTVLVSLRESR